MNITTDSELVLTGYNKFWPTSEKNAIFLGPWCFASNTKHSFTDYTKFNVIPSPWEKAVSILKASEYLDDLYDRLLPSLATVLNDFYNINYSNRFWKISTVSWTTHWLGILYDHYLRLKNLSALLPPGQKVKTKILDENSYINTENCMYLYSISHTHEFNLSVFSKIINNSAFNFLTCEKKSENIQHSKNIKPAQPQKRIKHKLKSLIKNCLNHPPIISYSSDFYIGAVNGLTYFDRLRIYAKRFKIHKAKFNNVKAIYPSKQHLDEQTFEFSPNSPFEKIVKKIFINSLPNDLLTAIPALKHSERVKYWLGSDIYHSQNKAFKIARTVENGGKWLAVQHGGGYGFNCSFPHGKTEYDSSDAFITWGWQHKHIYEQNNIPLPVPHLSKLENESQNKNHIMFISTMMPTYFYRNETVCFPKDILNYLKDKTVLLNNLLKNISEKVIYRPYPNSVKYGVNEVDFLRKNCKTNFLVNEKDKFYKLLFSSELAIIDHLHTTYLETLSLNIPTIVFCNTEIDKYMDTCIDDFDNLARVNIYHKTPESAANFINANIDTLKKWWNSPEVQKARLKFTQKYALTSPTYSDFWLDFIGKLP